MRLYFRQIVFILAYEESYCVLVFVDYSKIDIKHLTTIDGKDRNLFANVVGDLVVVKGTIMISHLFFILLNMDCKMCCYNDNI